MTRPKKEGIFTLKDSFHIILSKLENVDAVKERRYRYVYAKLKDFEDYMESLGVNTDFSSRKLQPGGTEGHCSGGCPRVHHQF